MERDSANGGIGGAARRVAEHARSVVRLELQLAAAEIRKKVAAFGVAIGLGAGAALFGVLAIGFAVATVTAVFATFLATWLALLVMTGIMLLLAAISGFLAVNRLKKSKPVPDLAIQETKRTLEAIRR
ncbi:MAG TPA: phage holin family protein [Gaiellaceae bacterium]|nr:phage holin family protein [Gaiellaceae bacterium]